jgi:hypothetical protein
LNINYRGKAEYTYGWFSASVGKINDMQTYNKEDLQMVQLQRIAPRPRQHPSMKLHLGYPTITKGHKLTGVTSVAKPITILIGFPPAA